MFLDKINIGKLQNKFQSLCLPAQIYLGLSVFSILMIFFNNLITGNYYCGLFKCKTILEKIYYFSFKVLYVMFWTYILQKFCSTGYTNVSWFIILFPYFLMFISLFVVKVVSKIK